MQKESRKGDCGSHTMYGVADAMMCADAGQLDHLCREAIIGDKVGLLHVISMCILEKYGIKTRI